MGEEGPGRNRRIWPYILGGVLLVVIGALLVLRIVIDDDANPVPLDDAVQRYRDESAPRVPVVATTGSATTEIAVAASVPSTGIYRYRTTGGESIDVLGGATHDYPPETTITVTPDGCGVRLRWDALEQRRDEWWLCVTARGVELQPTGLQFHEFFSQPDSEDVRCDAAVLVVPADGAPRPPVTQSCTLGSDQWLPVWEVVGSESRVVDGTSTPLTHVVMTINDSDEYDEHTNIDWYLDRHGLPVEVRNVKHSTSPSPIGSVVYDEHYTLELESLTPLR